MATAFLLPTVPAVGGKIALSFALAVPSPILRATALFGSLNAWGPVTKPACGNVPAVKALLTAPAGPGLALVYLALTGRVMNGLDSIYAGIGTHFIENEIKELIIKKIIDTNNYNNEFVDSILNENAQVLKSNVSSLSEEVGNIAKHFSKDTLCEIFESLEKDKSECKNTLEVLSKNLLPVWG